MGPTRENLVPSTLAVLSLLCKRLVQNYSHCFSFDHPNILAGQGTTGLEILEQVPDVDAVVIPTGGGGLLAGCAVALKTMNPNVKIIVSFKRHLKYLNRLVLF